jgi:hypothetical protein
MGRPRASGTWIWLLGLVALVGHGCNDSTAAHRQDAAQATDGPQPSAGASGGGAGGAASGGAGGGGGVTDSGGTNAGGLASGGSPDGSVDRGAVGAGGAPGVDASQPSDALSGDAFWGTVVRYCVGKVQPTARNVCRTVADCGPIGPIVCSVGYYDWGPAGCPLPPSSQTCPAECLKDEDCTARSGGTCIPYTQSCPRCDGHTCQYPPPPCTSSPDNCGTGQRCGADGVCTVIPCGEGNACHAGYRCNGASASADKQGCEPIPCNEGNPCTADRRCALGSLAADVFGCEPLPCDAGYACRADYRCSVGSARADSHGCELVPCADGYACPENTRCTVATPAANDHGCTTMACQSDRDCDCGYCVNGACSADPGTCQSPPA